MNYFYQRPRGVLRAIKRYGIFKYTKRLLHAAWGDVYKKQISTVFRRDLSDEVDILNAKVKLDIRVYLPSDKEVLYEFLTKYVRQDIIDNTLSQGLTPMLGFSGDELVALSWFTTEPLYLESLNLTLNYDEDAGYIEGSRTDDSMKGKSIAPAIRTRICKHLRDIGKKHVFVVAGDDNQASQAVALKCLFLPYESITMRRFLWLYNYSRKLL
jgi:hypothetical protein